MKIQKSGKTLRKVTSLAIGTIKVSVYIKDVPIQVQLIPLTLQALPKTLIIKKLNTLKVSVIILKNTVYRK